MICNVWNMNFLLNTKWRKEEKKISSFLFENKIEKREKKNKNKHKSEYTKVKKRVKNDAKKRISSGWHKHQKGHITFLLLLEEEEEEEEEISIFDIRTTTSQMFTVLPIPLYFYGNLIKTCEAGSFKLLVPEFVSLIVKWFVVVPNVLYKRKNKRGWICLLLFLFFLFVFFFFSKKQWNKSKNSMRQFKWHF